MLILPNEIAQIERDVADMVNGDDGANVIIHWKEKSGQTDEYGKAATEVDCSDVQRAHVTMVSNPTGVTRQVQRETNQDVQSADVVLVFNQKIDLTRAGLYFEIPKVGNFVPEAKPPTGGSSRPVLMLAGDPIMTEVYCRLKR